MGKRRAKWSSELYHKRIKEGRGQGEGKDYKPWITIQDIPSKGVCSRILGMKTGRIHHLLSRHETAFFYIVQDSDSVLDIREQFPLLDVLDTVRIAESAGIRHPRDPVSKYPNVLTSDFVLTTTHGTVVRTVKQETDLSDDRVREKLEIERRFWKQHGVEDWNIVTNRQIDYQKARNIEWANRSWHFAEMLPEGLTPEEVGNYFLEAYHRTYWSVTKIARHTEEHFGLEAGLGLTTFQYLIRTRQITVDMSQPLDLVSPRIDEEGGFGSWLPTYA